MNHVLRRTSICLALAATLHGAAASATEPSPGLPTIYVSANGGSDGNPGTAQAPKATINGALAAVTTTPAQVFVSDSLYSESIVLRAGVSLFGRFDPATWTRDPARVTTIQSAAEVFTGGNLSQPLAIDGFVLRSGSPASAGASSYVARLANGSGPVTFTRNRFVIASASAGAPGFAGTPGDNGGNGNPGIAGQANSSGGGQGGGGGASAAGRVGGSGGFGGFDSGNGVYGGTGSIGTTGGTGGQGNECFSATADNVGGVGQNGSNGTNGAPGPASATLGSFAASYIAPVGGNGTDGADGNGGGGGGGGGGGDNNNGFCSSDRGGGGGGGGGGGQDGRAGTGGRGGGGAFGIYTSGVPVIVDRNRFDFIAVGGGPRGGVGGNGGNGGARGLGGAPGLAGAGADDAAPGGRGGEGGDGGFGGPGAGGAGGPAIAVAAPAGNLLTLGSNRHDLPPPAAGGFGGINGAGGQAPAGPFGTVARAHPVSVNEPPAPILSIANVSIDRDPAGGTIQVPVPLNAPTDAVVSATYNIVAGTATAADIVLGSGTVTLASWDTQGLVPVTVLPSAPGTPTRSFTVQFSSHSGATLGATSAVVTLVSPSLFANGFEPAPAVR